MQHQKLSITLINKYKTFPLNHIVQHTFWIKKNEKKIFKSRIEKHFQTRKNDEKFMSKRVFCFVSVWEKIFLWEFELISTSWYYGQKFCIVLRYSLVVLDFQNCSIFVSIPHSHPVIVIVSCTKKFMSQFLESAKKSHLSTFFDFLSNFVSRREKIKKITQNLDSQTYFF